MWAKNTLRGKAPSNKTATLSTGMNVGKSSLNGIGRTYGLSLGFKMKPLRKGVFLC